MQRTKSKILSILLSLVMLLSLLPTTALAANYDKVKVNGIDLENGYYLENNSATSAETGANTEPTTYVAWYKDGVLTLNGYAGKGIETQGVAAGELTVKLIGTNSINSGSLVSDNGGDITVTSDSSGTLSISKTTSGSNPAIGIETGLSGGYTTGNVTIKGNAQVKIDMKHTGTSGSDVAYGIYAKKNITISENASVEITCATPNNTTGGGNCNGLYAAQNVIIDTNGTIKIDVTKAGKDAGYSFGVYPTGTATLTKVGEMEVQWKKHATHSSYPGGAVYKKGTSLSGTDYAINEDETNCYASYRKGTPYTVTVENGTLAGPGVVPDANNNGNFLAGDTVTIKPEEKKGKSNEVIPFKEWTSEQVTFTDPTTENNSFNVPANAVTVTAKHNPFVGAPTFKPTGTAGNEGTLTFTTKVKPDDGNEYFRLVKEADKDDESKYNTVLSPNNSPTASPYEYSYAATSGHGPSQVVAGDYYVAERLNGAWYLSEKFKVDYAAAPTVTYPGSVRVYNASGAITSLDDGQCLVTNDASATSYTGGAYVARYEKSTGTLYLKDYHGVAAAGQIYADGDLNIEVVSDSSFTTSLSSATNHLYGIQANGKLNISGSGKLTVTANGDGNVYGIYANEGVTISAPLDVQVGKVDSTKNGPLYGIYTQSGAISLSDKDKTITATGGTENVYGVYNAADTSTTITDNGNITISGNLTVNLSNGKQNRGISSQGGVITLNGATVKIPGNYYYGIFNINGNVDIKSNSDVDISSDISGNNGICTYSGGDLTIENSTVKVSAKGYAANQKGKLSIENSIVALTRNAEEYLVVNSAENAENTINLSTEGSVTLTASGEQTNYAMITGKVTLVGSTKCETGRINGSSYDGVYDGSSKTVLKFVHESTTPTAAVGDVSIAGTTGTAIADKEVIITLANDTFAPTLSGSWITNLPAGLSQSVSRTDDTHAKITVSGNPSAVSSDALAITIPAANLVSNTALTVTNNPSAVFAITAPATPITELLVPVTDLTGKTYNESAQEPTFGGGLTRDTDYTVSYAVKSGGTGGALDGGKPKDAGTYVVTVAGKGSYTGSFTKDFKIDKADPVYTAPTAKAGLAYTGSALKLITAGSVSKGGEMQYKLNSDAYSTTIPTATDAGNYTVHFKIVENDNYNAVPETQVGSTAINIAPANQNAPTGLGVAAPTASGGKGKITGTTTAMEYNTDAAATSGWTDCSATATEVAPGTYYVRLKANANHNAGAVSAALVVPAYSATSYSITVTNDGNGTASADKTSAVAGETVTLTATPKSGYVFDKWDDKTPTSLTIGTDGTFTMPSGNVSVKATFKPAALTGTVNITGALKYGQELTATLTGSNNTGNLDYKWYQNGTTQVAANNTGKYTLTADDIGKTITVKISSNVQTGEITGSTTGTIDKADGPVAPSVTPLACTNSSNNDGKITGVNTTMEYSAASDFSTKTACTSTVITGLANGTYYVRVAETTTHKAGTAATVNVPAYTPGTPTEYTITFNVNGGSGTIPSQTTSGQKLSSLPTATHSGSYSFAGWYTAASGGTQITTAYVFSGNTTVYAHWTYIGGGGGGGGSYTPSYTVSVDKTENGTITVSPKSASKGDAVTITVKPDKGYELEDLTVLDSKGKELALTEKNGKYTFKMPSGKVTVKGSFVEEAPVQIFKDVPVGAYYYEAVKWAAEKGITGGVGNGLFGPNQPCTRAQIVTFLWRAAGSPAPKNMSSFTDVPADAFYAKAVAWAVENGITGGTGDGKFSPDATCTRAQSVTFLYRAAGSPKVSGSAEFGDVATNAYYADAVAWAAKNGITGGIGGGLFGSGNDCTRGQIVTFLYRNYQSK